MNYKALFLISLTINVVGFYAFRRFAALSEVPRKEAPSGPETPVAPPAVKAVESPVTNTMIKPFNWESLESSDHKQYIANLRSVGCPQETIRDIIRADVNRLYDGKKTQVRQQAPTREYWKNPEEFARGAGHETWMKMFELDAERDALLRALGIEPDIRKDEAKRFNEFRSVFLPPYNNVDNPARLCYGIFSFTNR